jgi:hypothetical protein
MMNSVSWDVTSCGSCKIRRLGGRSRLHHQGDKNLQARTNVSSNYQLKHATKEYIYISWKCFPVASYC